MAYDGDIKKRYNLKGAVQHCTVYHIHGKITLQFLKSSLFFLILKFLKYHI